LASEAAQTLLDAHKLLAAREKLLLCTRTSCPTVIKRDCDELLSRADRTIPTVVLSTKDATGHDVLRAQVFLDGIAVPDALSGRAIPLDPGGHVLRVERLGSLAVELPIVAREGEHDRVVAVQLLPASSAVAPPLSSASTVPGWLPWTLGGVGVISLGTFVALAATGQSQYDTCKNAGCSSSESASLERERAGGFVALGVAVVAAGVSTWLFVKKSGETTVQAGAGPTAGGGSLQLQGTF
jgi:hypothetical protein